MSHPAAITTEGIARALRDAALIVAAPGGEAYVPLFERLERELAQRARQQDAVARAKAMLGQEWKSERA